jgi:DNA-binding FadR family transcriptional regulator
MDQLNEPPFSSPTLEPLKTLNTNQAIQDRVIQFIRESNLKGGDKLPSQQILAQRLGVSQVALREALRGLEALGILEVKKGSGWYVKDFNFDSVAKGLLYTIHFDSTSLADLTEIRMYLECSFLIHAIRTLQPDDLTELRQITNAMVSRAEAGEPLHDLDHQFHRKLFSTIRNKVFLEWMEVYWSIYINFLGTKVFPHERVEDARMHSDIVDAIEKEQTDRALAILEESFKRAKRRFQTPS